MKLTYVEAADIWVISKIKPKDQKAVKEITYQLRSKGNKCLITTKRFHIKKRSNQMEVIKLPNGNRGVLPERGCAPSSPVPPVSEQNRPTPPQKQPYIRVEFDDINKPKVWKDGKLVDKMTQLDIHWQTDTEQMNAKRFELTYWHDRLIKEGQANPLGFNNKEGLQ